MTKHDPDIARRVRENKLRRQAARQELQVIKSRRRDPRAVDYGTWWLAKLDGTIVLGDQHGTTIEALERYLTGDPR